MDSPVKPKHRLRQWVEKRWPVAPVIRWGSVEEIPGGTKFAYVLGSATLVLFVVLVITGVWQLLYYVPTVDHAYDSVMFLRLQVPLGWLIHGLHYWAAQGVHRGDGTSCGAGVHLGGLQEAPRTDLVAWAWCCCFWGRPSFSPGQSCLGTRWGIGPERSEPAWRERCRWSGTS